LIGQPEGLNPILVSNAALREISPLLFETLLRVDPETAELQPGLAQRWDYSADGRQVTFKLPPDLAWSDSSPLTAAAIIESWQASRHPALLAFSDLAAPDEKTIRLTFTRIDCSALVDLALLPLLPASQILDPAPIGSGPFMVAGHSENRRTLTLVRNPNYHGQTPWLEQLIIRFIKETEAEIALSEGQFDVIGPIPFKTDNPEPELLVELTYPAPQVIYLAINFKPRNETPVLPAVRQALLLALDREAILAEALAGDGQLLAGSLLPGHWAAHPELSSPTYEPAAARALLAQAGLTDANFDGWLDQEGRRVELAIRVNGANPLQQRLGWLVSNYYRDLGLFARAESSPPDSVIDDLFTHDFSLAIFSWPLLPDPDQRLFWRSSENTEGEGLNFVSLDNPSLDRLLDKGIAMPGCRPEDRREIYAQIEEILSRERPVDFLLTPNQHLFVAKRLLGVEPGPFAPFTWNIQAWSLKPE
jgi:peptide/nickel transport system substrate-binding protein